MGLKVYRPRHQGLPFAPSAQFAGLNSAGLDLAASHFVGIVTVFGVSRALTGSFLLDKTIVNKAKNASNEITQDETQRLYGPDSYAGTELQIRLLNA